MPFKRVLTLTIVALLMLGLMGLASADPCARICDDYNWCWHVYDGGRCSCKSIGKVEGGKLKWSCIPVRYDPCGRMHKCKGDCSYSRCCRPCYSYCPRTCKPVKSYRLRECCRPYWWGVDLEKLGIDLPKGVGDRRHHAALGGDRKALLEAAQALYDVGKIDAAISMANQAKQCAGKWAPPYSLLGKCYQEKGDKAKAAECYRKAISYGSKLASDLDGLKACL